MKSIKTIRGVKMVVVVMMMVVVMIVMMVLMTIGAYHLKFIHCLYTGAIFLLTPPIDSQNTDERWESESLVSML